MGTISRFMESDHKRLSTLWQSFLESTQNGSEPRATFSIFYKHLQRHMELEETLLFPRFEDFTGLSHENGPTTQLYRDHAAIRKLLEDINAACDSCDLDKIRFTGEHLGNALSAHEKRENEVSYRLFDTFVPPQEWRGAILRIYGIDTETLNDNTTHLLPTN